MSPQWEADLAIDAGLARRLIDDQFPAFAGAPLEPFGAGWDNAAFLVDGSTVFRFPRRRVAIKLMAREIALLPRFAARLPLPISAPRYVGRPADASATIGYAAPFAGYGLLPGRPASSLPLSDAARHALAAPLGAFLRTLHDTDVTPLISAGLPDDEIGRLDHRKRRSLVRERLPTVRACGLVADVDRFAGWLDNNPPRPLPAGRERLVHGDLYARHVLVGDDGPTGIIDWGDVHRGDPAIDLAIAHLLLPPAAHAAFRAAYGEVDAATWNAARYRAMYHAILELDYGVREDDRGMREIGAIALEFLRPLLGT